MCFLYNYQHFDTAITSNTTLNNNQAYRINKCIAVIIQKGATIDAEGTEDCPITFTSAAAPGMRVPIKAGMVIAGKEELNRSPLTLSCSVIHTAKNDNTDNSGVLRYLLFSYLSD